MISLKKWPWILFGTVISIALWTFLSVNTGLFGVDEEFNYFLYITSYVLIVGIWALFVLKLNLSEQVHKFISVLIFILTPFFCMQITMVLSGAAEYSFGIYFINIMFYVAIMAIFLAVTRSLKCSSIITTSVAYLFNMASFVVNILRGTPLIPSDFLAMGTAAQVAENYKFQMEYQIVASTIIAVLAIVLAARFSFKPKFKYKNIVLPVGGIAVALVFVISVSAVDYTNISMDVFDQYHANNTHGTPYSFYINVRKMMLKKPDGYNKDKAEAMLASSQTENAVLTDDMPNIIAIMNESFSDLSVVGDFETSSAVTPFMDSMKKNTVKGELLVSPFGGYTCNTEFEFLTGLSMGLLPNGSTPYLQFVSKEYPLALPSYLSDIGYKTVAVHPYFARCWNRTKVYDLIGFDEFFSIENFDKCVDENEWEYVRNYMSDKTSFKALENLLEEKKDDERLFLFNITMQNHGGYTYESSEFPTVTITDMNGHYKETEQYLSLIQKSDEAFEELISYLKNYDEPTVVLMFGDHQPAVEQQFYEELYGKSISSLSYEELQQRYKVPFVIWANYDITEGEGISTSTNYLSNLLLDVAGVPKSEVGNFTAQISAEIPQINGMGHYDNGGFWCENDTEKSETLKDYEMLEYYLLGR